MVKEASLTLKVLEKQMIKFTSVKYEKKCYIQYFY